MDRILELTASAVIGVLARSNAEVKPVADTERFAI
jgi:hypothetical protein